MAALFRTPKQPEVKMPDPLPPAPERSDAQTADLAEAQRRRFASGGGRAMTLLSGGSGVASVMTASRFLGNAART